MSNPSWNNLMQDVIANLDETHDTKKMYDIVAAIIKQLNELTDQVNAIQSKIDNTTPTSATQTVKQVDS